MTKGARASGTQLDFTSEKCLTFHWSRGSLRYRRNVGSDNESVFPHFGRIFGFEYLTAKAV